MKELVLKDWLYQKIARENGCPRIWSGHVDAVFQETEKAYRVLMGSVNHPVYTWVPKSQVEWVHVENENEETVIVNGYEEAVAHKNHLRAYYC